MKPISLAFGLFLFVSCSDLLAADDAAVLSLGLGKIFTFFFLTLGPASVVVPFVRATAKRDVGTRRRVAFAATGISLFAVLVAATIGRYVLTSWGISTGALLIAAGIILFLVALQSIRSQYSPPAGATEIQSGEVSFWRLAFQLAFPYIVSPYGIAIVILVLTTRPDSVPVTPIFAMLVGIMLVNATVMLAAHRIAGSMYLVPTVAVVSSVLSVLQAALGVQAVITGLKLAGVT